METVGATASWWPLLSIILSPHACLPPPLILAFLQTSDVGCLHLIWKWPQRSLVPTHPPQLFLPHSHSQVRSNFSFSFSPEALTQGIICTTEFLVELEQVDLYHSQNQVISNYFVCFFDFAWPETESRAPGTPGPQFTCQIHPQLLNLLQHFNYILLFLVCVWWHVCHRIVREQLLSVVSPLLYCATQE